MATTQGEIRVGPQNQVKDIYVRERERDGNSKFSYPNFLGVFYRGGLRKRPTVVSPNVSSRQSIIFKVPDWPFSLMVAKFMWSG